MPFAVGIIFIYNFTARYRLFFLCHSSSVYLLCHIFQHIIERISHVHVLRQLTINATRSCAMNAIIASTTDTIIAKMPMKNKTLFIVLYFR